MELRARGRSVVDGMEALALRFVPGEMKGERAELVQYCMSIVGSLIGAGGQQQQQRGMGAFWAVGDAIERRLETSAADSAQSIGRFKLLRAELSASKAITKKT
jgi:hypothetical protein